MKIFISNFLHRVIEYIQRNRARLLKWLLILAAGLIVLILIYGLIESVTKARYEKRIQELDQQFRDAEIRAADALGRAAVIEAAIETKNAEIDELEMRADAAERKLGQTHAVYLPLKEKYEEARNAPDIPAGISECDACQELAAAGHPCK